jgi:WD40 repeat protein
MIRYTPWELVHDLAWSPDGSQLAVSAGDWVHIYNTATLGELQVLYTAAWAVDLDYQLSEILALAAKDGSLQFWEPNTGSLLCRMQAHDKGANSLDIYPSDRLLASAGNDAILRLWDLAPLLEGDIPKSGDEDCDLQLTAELIGGAFAVPAVRFNPDGTLVASIDLQVVRLRDPLTQRLVSSLRAENSLFDIAFSPDGRWLASAELGNQVRLWEVSTGEVLHTLPSGESQSNFMWRAAFSPDGEILAAGSSDGTITLWEAASGELLRTISAHTRSVTALEFSPDGRWLASGSLDANVLLWEVGK